MLLQKMKRNKRKSRNMSVVCSALWAVKHRNIQTLVARSNLYGQVWWNSRSQGQRQIRKRTI